MKKALLSILALAFLGSISAEAQIATRVTASCTTISWTWAADDLGRQIAIDTKGRLCDSGDAGGAAASQIQGNVAHGTADSGNPVKIGGIFNTTLPTMSNLQRGDAQLDASGNLRTLMTAQATTGADGVANANLVWPSLSTSPTAGARPLGIALHGFNSTSWDRLRTLGAVTTDGTTGTGILVQGNLVYNGATWDRQFVCNSTAVINVTAGATTELVALTASQIIRVCAFTVSMSAAGSAQFVYGTGTNCGTGTTSLTGAVPLATTTPWAQAGSSGMNLFRGAVSNALCLAAVTGNAVGYVTYAKF